MFVFMKFIYSASGNEKEKFFGESAKKNSTTNTTGTEELRIFIFH